MDKATDKVLKQIEQIHSRAVDHISSLVDQQVLRGLSAFATKLKPSTKLELLCGNGSMHIQIVRDGRRDLNVSSGDVYYSYYSKGRDFNYVAGQKQSLRDLLYPLQELLRFADAANSANRDVWPNSQTVRGTRRKVARFVSDQQPL